MERQKHGASLLDDDDDDDDDDDEEDSEDLAALQSVLDVSLGSSGGARSSGADSSAGTGAKESFAQKWVALPPLWGPGPKLP